MSRPLFSGSRAEIAAKCLGVSVLSHSEHRTEEADSGSARHEAVAKFVSTGEKTEISGVDYDSLPVTSPGAYASEVAFVLDLSTGKAREIGRNIGRKYPQLDLTEIPLTVDVVGLLSDGESVDVGDFKSHEFPAPAKDSWQLRLGALAACRAYGRTRARVWFAALDGSRKPDVAEFDEMDIDSIAMEAKRLFERAASARLAHEQSGVIPSLFEGNHCRYCPAFSMCPAKASLASSLVANDGFPALTPETAAKAWQRIKAIKEVVERAEETIREMAKAQPLELGNGKRLCAVEQTRESVDGTIVHQVLSERFGADVASAAVELKSTKSAIEKALKSKAKNGELAGLKREVFDQLRKAGGVRETSFVMVKEV